MMINDNPKITSNQKAIDRLKCFNETVDLLQGFNFWKNFPSKSGFNISWDNTDEGVKINSKILGPDDESISAFILKYRLFIQNKDDISLRNIDNLYSELPIDNSYYSSFKVCRKKINEVLDQPTTIVIKKHKVTIREVHDMFIYGNWAHVNDKDVNRKNFISIKDNPVIYPIFTNDFNTTLVKVMNELVQIKFLNQEVINKLGDQ